MARKRNRPAATVLRAAAPGLAVPAAQLTAHALGMHIVLDPITVLSWLAVPAGAALGLLAGRRESHTA